MNIKELMGSGDKVMLFTLPFLVVGLALNILRPEWFRVGGPAPALAAVSAVLLFAGVVVWIWSVVLILLRVPRKKLITEGPYALVKHPLYAGVSLLVLPWLGFLLNSWVGALIGGALYVGNRLFAVEEERKLAAAFGPEWEKYKSKVLLPWL
jgi:protein-S-isoprenylcysteine O-methyltransferase Ste14